MKQSALDRAVARATGESIAVIRKMGFSVTSPPANTRPSWPGRSRKQSRRGKLVTASSEA